MADEGGGAARVRRPAGRGRARSVTRARRRGHRRRCVQPSVTECMLIAGDDVAMHAAWPGGWSDGPDPVRRARVRRDRPRVGDRRSPGPPRLPGHPPSRRSPCGPWRPCRRDPGRSAPAADFIGFTRPGAFAEQHLVPDPRLVSRSGSSGARPPQPSSPSPGPSTPTPPPRSARARASWSSAAGVMGLLAIQVARRGRPAWSWRPAGIPPNWPGGRSRRRPRPRRRRGRAVGASGATDGIGADVVIETAGGIGSAGLSGTATLELAARALAAGDASSWSRCWRAGPGAVGLLREQRSACYTRGREPAAHSASRRCSTTPAVGGRGDVDVESLITHGLAGIAALPAAVRITRDKAEHGAINPAQVDGWSGVGGHDALLSATSSARPSGRSPARSPGTRPPGVTFGRLEDAPTAPPTPCTGLGAEPGDRLAGSPPRRCGPSPALVACARLGALFAPLNPASGRRADRVPTPASAAPSGAGRPRPGVRGLPGRRTTAHRGRSDRRPTGPDLTAAHPGRGIVAPGRQPASDTDPHIVYLTSGSTGRPRACWSATGPAGCGPPRAAGRSPRACAAGAGWFCSFPLFHYGGWHYVMEASQARRGPPGPSGQTPGTS